MLSDFGVERRQTFLVNYADQGPYQRWVTSQKLTLSLVIFSSAEGTNTFQPGSVLCQKLRENIPSNLFFHAGSKLGTSRNNRAWDKWRHGLASLSLHFLLRLITVWLEFFYDINTPCIDWKILLQVRCPRFLEENAGQEDNVCGRLSEPQQLAVTSVLAIRWCPELNHHTGE